MMIASVTQREEFHAAAKGIDMQLTDRVQAFAAIILVTLCVLGPRLAGAAVHQNPVVESLAPISADCIACGQEADGSGRGMTLPVNLAILALGSLWLALMVRRIQQHAAARGLSSGGLRSGGRQPAEAGR